MRELCWLQIRPEHWLLAVEGLVFLTFLRPGPCTLQPFSPSLIQGESPSPEGTLRPRL